MIPNIPKLVLKPKLAQFLLLIKKKKIKPENSFKNVLVEIS